MAGVTLLWVLLCLAFGWCSATDVSVTAQQEHDYLAVVFLGLSMITTLLLFNGRVCGL